MATKIPSGTDLDRQIRAARAAESRARAQGRRASAVMYDGRTRRVLVELTNGIEIAFPLSIFPEIAHAAPAQLRRVVLSPSGSGIAWRDLDADYSVPGLLAWAAGTHANALALGRAGGRARSEAKAAAARANGARGGRPRSKSGATRSARHVAGKK